jgi:hypothetical protein
MYVDALAGAVGATRSPGLGSRRPTRLLTLFYSPWAFGRRIAAVDVSDSSGGGIEWQAGSAGRINEHGVAHQLAKGWTVACRGRGGVRSVRVRSACGGG